MKYSPIFVISLFGLLFTSCSSDSDSDTDPDPPIIEPPIEVRTDIPDSNFEAALVALNLDDEVDGSVLTSRIIGVTRLDVQGEGIADLTGIEDFVALIDLNVRENELTTLDVSSNNDLLFVWAEDNQLSSLELGTNPNIEKIGASGNNLSGFIVTEYTTLQLLDLADNNIGAMDVSTLPLPAFNEFNIEGNPLTCIRVSPEQFDDIPESWTKDPEDTWSLDCE